MITMDNQYALYRYDIISVKYLFELFDKTKTQLNQNFHEKNSLKVLLIYIYRYKKLINYLHIK